MESTYMNNLDYILRMFAGDLRRRILRGLNNSEVTCHFEPGHGENEEGMIFVEIHNLTTDIRYETAVEVEQALTAINNDDPRDLISQIRSDYRNYIFETHFKQRRKPSDDSYNRPSASICQSSSYEPEAPATEEQLEALQRQFAGERAVEDDIS